MKITEKTRVQASDFTEKVEAISIKVMTDKNKNKAKKVMKIIGVVLTVLIIVDVLAMILYFLFWGISK